MWKWTSQVIRTSGRPFWTSQRTSGCHTWWRISRGVKTTLNCTTARCEEGVHGNVSHDRTSWTALQSIFRSEVRVTHMTKQLVATLPMYTAQITTVRGFPKLYWSSARPSLCIVQSTDHIWSNHRWPHDLYVKHFQRWACLLQYAVIRDVSVHGCDEGV